MADERKNFYRIKLSYTAPVFSYITLVYRNDIFKKCLYESIVPTLKKDGELIIINNLNNKYSAATGFNLGVKLSSGKFLVFVHSDISLPKDFYSCLSHLMENNYYLNENCILGTAGMDWTGDPVGCSYQYYHNNEYKNKMFGKPEKKPQYAQILDEQLLVVLVT